VVAASAVTWGAGVDVVAALGHGRSYGADSWFLGRTITGILGCGLWRHLEAAPRVATRALVTDVGNDILYGFPPEQTLAWIDEAVRRLQQYTDDIVLTGLPLASIRTVSPLKFSVFRAVLAPSCTLALRDVAERAEVVHEGLATIAASRRVAFFELEPSWYGVDPIHIRRRFWRDAWQAILGTQARLGGFSTEGLRLYLMRPEHEQWFGVTRETPQTGRPSTTGARVWLY
jgi:hypothetical protein